MSISAPRCRRASASCAIPKLLALAFILSSLTSCVDEPDTLGLGEAYPYGVPELEAIGTSATSIRLTWSGVTGAEAYWVQGTDDPTQWGWGNSPIRSEWIRSSEADSNNQYSKEFSRLTPERTYYFRIRAEEGSYGGPHSRWSRILLAKATDETPPPPVSYVEATDLDGRSWDLDWYTPSGVVGFEVRYSTSTEISEWNQMRSLPTVVPRAMSDSFHWTLRDEDLLGDLALEEVRTMGVRCLDAAGNLSEPVYFRPEVRIKPRDFRNLEILTGDFPCFVTWKDQLAGRARDRLRLAQSCFTTSLVDLAADPVEPQCEVGPRIDLTKIYTASEGWSFAYVSETDPESLTVELLLEGFSQTESDCQSRSVRVGHDGAQYLVPSRDVFAFTASPGPGHDGQPFSVFLHNDQTGAFVEEIVVDPPSLHTQYFPEFDDVWVREVFADNSGVGLLLAIGRIGKWTSAFAHLDYSGEATQAWRFDADVGVDEATWFYSTQPVVYAEKRVPYQLEPLRGIWVPCGDPHPPSGVRDMQFFDLARVSIEGSLEIIGMTLRNSSYGWLLLRDASHDLRLLEFND